MKNNNLKVVKKAGEERYFKNWQEFFVWQARQANSTQKEVDEHIDGMYRQFKEAEGVEAADQWTKRHCPHDDGDMFVVSGDNHYREYVLNVGAYVRKSGTYKLNVLAIA